MRNKSANNYRDLEDLELNDTHSRKNRPEMVALL